MANKTKYELRNTEADEVLRPISKWIGRWGFITLFTCMAMLIVLSKMIRLPDIRRAPVVLQCENNRELFALAAIRQEDVRSIQPGNEVLIDISGWNAAEFGSLNGYIDSVYTSPATAGTVQFTARIQLPGKNTTNKKKVIAHSCGLKGNGRITVQKRTMFDAVFRK